MEVVANATASNEYFMSLLALIDRSEGLLLEILCIIIRVLDLEYVLM